MSSKTPLRISSSINRFIGPTVASSHLFQTIASLFCGADCSDLLTQYVVLNLKVDAPRELWFQFKDGVSSTIGGRGRRRNRKDLNPSGAINTGKSAPMRSAGGRFWTIGIGGPQIGDSLETETLRFLFEGSDSLPD